MKFVCCLWRGAGFWKNVAKYDERHVLTLASMLKRNGGHELLCVQDGSFNLPGSIVMLDAVKALPNYLPKLWLWSPEFHAIVGSRFSAIDLDVVIAANLGPLLNGKEPFRIWNRANGEPYNSSLFALQPGFGQSVWTRLSLDAVEKARASKERWTGDQSWIAHVLGPSMPTFGEKDGVIQYRPKRHRAEMPKGMLAGFMCGPYEPASEAELSPWVKKLWV